MSDFAQNGAPRTLAELDRLAAPLHARVITREGMETMMRLTYEKGMADARAASQERPPIDVERLLELVLLEAAHYNVFQGKVAHANLRMIVDAARDSATRLSGSVGEP